MTFRDYSERWIDANEPYLKASTARVYRGVITRINKEFGSLTCQDIQWQKVKPWLRSLGVSRRSANNYLSVFRTVLDEAVEDRLLEENPLEGKTLRMKSRDVEKEDIQPFSAKERYAILTGCADPQERNLFEFLMWSGLRISEAIALQWADVDFAAGAIHVRGAKTTDAKRIERTKTRAGRRVVKMLERARDALSNQRQWSFFAQQEVFLNPRTGKPWSGDQPIRRAFQAACEHSGVAYRHPYMLRHTYASAMLTAGEDLGWVASQLGHTNPAMTGAVYAQYIPQDDDKGGQLAEGKYGQP